MAVKCAVLFYHSVFDHEIQAMLDAVDCQHYVEIPKAWARDDGERRFGTHIYPGTDSVILAFLDDEPAARLAEAVRQFKTDKVRMHTRLAVLPVEQFF
jgi:hypothetical protein